MTTLLLVPAAWIAFLLLERLWQSRRRRAEAQTARRRLRQVMDDHDVALVCAGCEIVWCSSEPGPTERMDAAYERLAQQLTEEGANLLAKERRGEAA